MKKCLLLAALMSAVFQMQGSSNATETQQKLDLAFYNLAHAAGATQKALYNLCKAESNGLPTHEMWTKYDESLRQQNNAMIAFMGQENPLICEKLKLSRNEQEKIFGISHEAAP